MKIFNWQHISHWFMQFLIAQLFLTLISLPILIAWGLPLSALSPIGNLVFNPFLTLYLLLSSIIFFTQMVYIPNEWFIWVLEKLTASWHYFLTFSSHSALFAFKKPSIIILILIPLVAIAVICHPFMRRPLNRLAGLIVVSVCTWSVLSFNPTIPNWHTTINCNNGFVTIIHQNNKTILLDPGVIGSRISAPSWVSYTLLPELTKLTGSVTIDYVICTKLGKMYFEALQTLCTSIYVKKLYLPAYRGQFEPHIQKAFNKFYAIAKSNNTQIIRTYDKSISITEEQVSIAIIPDSKQTYNTVEYMMNTIEASIDNESIPIYSRRNNQT